MLIEFWVSNNPNAPFFVVWLITDSVVPSFLAGNKRLVSSAKWWTADFEKTFCRSFVWGRKSKEPNIEPCRTPQVTVLTLGECPGNWHIAFCIRKMTLTNYWPVHGYRKNQV